MSVDLFFAIGVGCGSGEFQQVVRLIHHQRGVELTQPQQVATEHPAERGERRSGDVHLRNNYL